MLMARCELSFRIPPVSESCAASKTIRQRIGRRIDMKKACFIGLSLLGFDQTDRATKAGSGIFSRYFIGFNEQSPCTICIATKVRRLTIIDHKSGEGLTSPKLNSRCVGALNLLDENKQYVVT